MYAGVYHNRKSVDYNSIRRRFDPDCVVADWYLLWGLYDEIFNDKGQLGVYLTARVIRYSMIS